MIKQLSSFSFKYCAVWQLLCGCDNYVKAWGAIKGLRPSASEELLANY